MRRVSIKAFLIGGIVDVVSSALLGIPLIILAIAIKGLPAVSREQVGPALVRVIHGSALLYSIQLLIGFGCSVLGGYVAGRIAKHDHILNGLLASGVCMAIGVYSIAKGKSVDPLAVQLVLLLIVTPGAGILGGYLASRQSPTRSSTA